MPDVSRKERKVIKRRQGELGVQEMIMEALVTSQRGEVYEERTGNKSVPAETRERCHFQSENKTRRKSGRVEREVKDGLTRSRSGVEFKGFAEYKEVPTRPE